MIWAREASGEYPGKSFFDESLTITEKAKMVNLFQRLAEVGQIHNRDQFKQLGDRAKGEARSFFEFKIFQVRFIGEFRPEKRFVIACGARKQTDKLKSADIERARRILREYEPENR